MKHTKILWLLAATLVLTDVPVEAWASAAKPTADVANVSAIGRRRKGYKPRRGGLFNTGLFKKKNPCGCPNH